MMFEQKQVVPSPESTATEAVATLEELRAGFRASSAAFQSSASKLSDSRARVSKVIAQISATEDETKAIRAKWRKLLHESDGIVTSDIQALRASERASFVLFEELNDLLAALKENERLIEIDLAELYPPAESASRDLRARIADAALDAAVDECALVLSTALAALRIVEPDQAAQKLMARIERGVRHHGEVADIAARKLLEDTEFDCTALAPRLRRSHMARLQLRRGQSAE